MVRMEKKLHYSKNDAGLGFLNAILFPALISLAYTFIVMILAGIFKLNTDSINKSYWFIIPALFISPLAFIISFLLVNKYGKVDSYKALGLYNKVKVSNVFVCMIISIICVFGIIHFVNFYDAIVSAIGFKGDYSMPLPLTSVWWLILNLFLIALLPAICEELIFRGVVFNGLRDKGNIFAVFASAALFMLVHGSVEQTVYPFIVGCVLGFVMLKTNNIIYPMIIHFCNNAIVLIYNYIQIQTGFGTTNFAFTAYNILFAILMLILSILMIWIVIKFLLKGRKPVQREKDNSPINKFMIYAIICGIILWIADLLSGFGVIK